MSDLLQNHRLTDTMRLLDSMSCLNERIGPSQYNPLLKYFFSMNQPRLAIECFQVLCRSDAAIVPPDAATYSLMIEGCKSYSLYTHALCIARRFVHEGNIQPNHQVWSAITCLFVSLGDMDAASVLFNKLVADSQPSTDVLATLIKACISRGDFTSAKRYAEYASRMPSAVSDASLEMLNNKLVFRDTHDSLVILERYNRFIKAYAISDLAVKSLHPLYGMYCDLLMYVKDCNDTAVFDRLLADAASFGIDSFALYPILITNLADRLNIDQSLAYLVRLARHYNTQGFSAALPDNLPFKQPSFFRSQPTADPTNMNIVLPRTRQCLLMMQSMAICAARTKNSDIAYFLICAMRRNKFEVSPDIINAILAADLHDSRPLERTLLNLCAVMGYEQEDGSNRDLLEAVNQQARNRKRKWFNWYVELSPSATSLQHKAYISITQAQQRKLQTVRPPPYKIFRHLPVNCESFIYMMDYFGLQQKMLGRALLIWDYYCKMFGPFKGLWDPGASIQESSLQSPANNNHMKQTNKSRNEIRLDELYIEDDSYIVNTGRGLVYPSLKVVDTLMRIAAFHCREPFTQVELLDERRKHHS